MATISMPTRLEYKWWDKFKPDDLPKTGVGQVLKEVEKIDVAALVKMWRGLKGKDNATIKAKTGIDPNQLAEARTTIEGMLQPYTKLGKMLKDLRDGIRGVPKHKDFVKALEVMLEIGQADCKLVRDAMDETLAAGNVATQAELAVKQQRAQADAKKLGGAKLKEFEEYLEKMTRSIRASRDKITPLVAKAEKTATPQDFAKSIAEFKALRDQIENLSKQNTAYVARMEASVAELHGKPGFDEALFRSGLKELRQHWTDTDKLVETANEKMVAHGKTLQSGKATAKQFVNTPAKGSGAGG